MSKGRLLRLERLRQEGRALENGGLLFRDWSLGEDDWLTSHDEEEQHGSSAEASLVGKGSR